MSTIRDYLEQKAATPREWLRREPRETHPEILAAVRACIGAAPPGRTVYDEDAERAVHALAGDLPPYFRHAHEERGPLVDQLGHEVYIARHCLRDEEATAEIMRALDDGYVPLADAEVREGARYLVRFGTLYSGYIVPVYGKPHEVKARYFDGRLAFMPKGARTRGYDPERSSGVLVREVVKGPG